MPRPTIDLERYRLGMELRIAEGRTHQEIRDWLRDHGVVIQGTAFKIRLRQ